jgi:type IV pilus assembly protein PilE
MFALTRRAENPLLAACDRVPPAMRHPSRQNGFTLIELMVVVAIIAILGAIAMPIYTDYVVRGKLTEARNVLSHYRVAMEQYYQDHRSYADAGGTVCGVVLLRPDYFAVDCKPANDGQSFIATASGKPDSGVTDFSFSIDERGRRGTPSLPAGWGTPGTPCWVSRKGGACQ